MNTEVYIPPEVFELYPYERGQTGVPFQIIYERIQQGEPSGEIESGSGRLLKYSFGKSEFYPTTDLIITDSENPRYRLTANLRSGVLGFHVLTRTPNGEGPFELHPDFWGKDFVNFGVNFFRAISVVDELKAEWHISKGSSINFQQFRAHYEQNGSAFKAVQSTWTAQVYKEIGFSKLTYVGITREKNFPYIHAFFSSDLKSVNSVDEQDLVDMEENFSKRYHSELHRYLVSQEASSIPEELLKVTEGTWLKYRSYFGSITPLLNLIARYDSGWCSRGEALEEEHDKYDFHVFLSNDAEGEPTTPRLLLFVNDKNEVVKIAGVGDHEQLDPYIESVLNTKLEDEQFGTKK